MARDVLKQARRQVFVDLSVQHAEDIRYDINLIRNYVKKGKFTLDEIDTSDKELKLICLMALYLCQSI